MAFFTTSPRFSNIIVTNGVTINQSSNKTTFQAKSLQQIPSPKSAFGDVSPTSVADLAATPSPLTTRSARTSPSHHSHTVGRNCSSPHSLRRPITPIHTSSFGTSSRSSPLSKSVNGYITHTKPTNIQDLGPGSFTDCHYRGSPDVVASLMLHKSFNVKATNGNNAEMQHQHNLPYPDIPMNPNPNNYFDASLDIQQENNEYGNKNIRSAKKGKKRSSTPVKPGKSFNITSFTQNYEDFAKAEVGGVDKGTKGMNMKGVTKVKPSPGSLRPHRHDLWSASSRSVLNKSVV